MPSTLQLEDATDLLLEDGTAILLEDDTGGGPPDPVKEAADSGSGTGQLVSSATSTGQTPGSSDTAGLVTSVTGAE